MDWSAFGVLCAVLALIFSASAFFQERRTYETVERLEELLETLKLASGKYDIKNDDQDSIIDGIIKSGAADTSAALALLVLELEHGDEERERIDREGRDAREILRKAIANDNWTLTNTAKYVHTLKGQMTLLLSLNGQEPMTDKETGP